MTFGKLTSYCNASIPIHKPDFSISDHAQNTLLTVSDHGVIIKGPLQIGLLTSKWHLIYGDNRIGLDRKPNLIFRILARLAGFKVTRISIESNRDVIVGDVSIVAIKGTTILNTDLLNDSSAKIMFKANCRLTLYELGIGSYDNELIFEITIVWSEKIAYIVEKSTLNPIKIGPKLFEYLNKKAKAKAQLIYS